MQKSATKQSCLLGGRAIKNFGLQISLASKKTKQKRRLGQSIRFFFCFFFGKWEQKMPISPSPSPSSPINHNLGKYQAVNPPLAIFLNKKKKNSL
jgi:hypothetical protein